MWLKSRKVVNLALQGGGAHGAFTWGVLDRLLEDERLVIEGISGTSSGAMNAVAVAYGLTVDGREGARHALASLWNRVGVNIPGYSPTAGGIAVDRSLALEGALALTRVFSPYQLNPMNLDPLREIVTSVFDFEQLREHCELKLYIAATQVRTGKLRLFETREITPDALLASACLPTLHHAIVIDGEAYWDGGYAGNPALFPLFYNCRARDIVVVLLHPLSRPELPTSVSSIQHRTAELSFGTTFLREMRSIVQAKQQVGGHFWSLGSFERRLRRLNVHLIEPDCALTELDGVSKLHNDSAFLNWLKDRGRAQADSWLRQNFRSLGRESSIDLAALFG
ncbi:MAG: patatin-like phospholipase family protein [Gammaproteobacteria bacterium]